MRWVLSLFVLAACATEPTTLDRGVLFLHGQSMIEVPRIVSVEEMFRISITTWGNDCTRPDTTDLTLTDDSATLVPYDRWTAPADGSPCSTAPRPFLHDNYFAFPAAGAKTILIQGRHEDGDDIELPFEMFVE